VTTKDVPEVVAEDADRKRKLALLRAIGLDKLSEEQRELALNIAKRYELDLLLHQAVIIDGKIYVTRDGLLHIAHRSGQFDGIEVTPPVLEGEFWRATASVFRKDMGRPFTYPGRYPAKGGNTRFAPEMAIKVAEVMALRRAFDVSAPVAEERWDRDLPEPPVAPQTLAERVAQKRNVLAANHEDVPLGGHMGAKPQQPAAVEDGEPELLGDPMTEADSASLPGLCMAEDTALDTGPCEQPAGHFGPHKNAGGVWPNR